MNLFGHRARRPAWIGIALVLTALAAGILIRLNRASPDGAVAPPDSTAAAPAETYSGPPWFRDLTTESGVNFICRNGEEADQFTILESLGGGVALLDYDGDGRLDLFFAGGGTFEGPSRTEIRGKPCALYRNLGNWKFQEVTAEAGLAGPWWYTHGIAVADFDCDGWPDLFVTGYGRQALYHNEPDSRGGRRFLDITKKAGLEDAGWSTGAGWADLDGDGFPELYVCRYTDWSFANNPPCAGQSPDTPRDICPPHRFTPLVHALYKNENGQRFRNIASESGFKPEGYGLGVVLADLNGDARPDIYVTNDMTRNFLYFNRGSGRLEENALAAGVAIDDSGRATASMGIDAADYDGSGRPSLIISNFQRELPSLFRNLGKERFYYQSQAAGLAALGRDNVGWGARFTDADNDGWPDLVLVNGHLFRRPAGASVKQKPLLLVNRENGGRRVFVDAGGRGGSYFNTSTVARGLAAGDLDNDGWPDLVVSHVNTPVTVLRNEAVERKNHWIGVRLLGRSHRSIVGSTITVTVGDRTLTAFAKGGGSYLSANDQRLLFGLGPTSQPVRVKVNWAWGKPEVWENLAPGQYHDLREGERSP